MTSKLFMNLKGVFGSLRSGKERSVVLARGQNSTWSPVGDWVAFCDHGTYYSLHPGEGTPQKLFHRKRAASGLYWSPDARFVAYVVEDWFALDVESYSRQGEASGGQFR